MKVLLGITLLIVSVHSAALIKRFTGTTGLPKFNATTTPGIRNRRYAEKPDISLINELRRAVATAGNIDMPDLVWDEKLVAAAKDMNSNCEEVKHGPNYRFFMEGPDKNAQKMIEFYYAILLALDQVNNTPLTNDQRDVMKTLKTLFEAKQHEISFMLFELFNPNQTTIGCAQSRCDAVIPDENKALVELANAIGMDGLTYSFDIMCSIGPNRLWDKDELQTVEYAARQTKVMDKKSLVDFSKPAHEDLSLEVEGPSGPRGQFQNTRSSPPPESANGESQKDTESSGSSTSFQLAFLLSLLGFLM